MTPDKSKELLTQVELVLRDIPETRDSDRLLVWEVWSRFYYIGGTVSRESFLDALPSWDSISRLRRKVQHELKLYPSSEQIERERKRIEQETKGALGYKVTERGGQFSFA